jgi:hypothetical protein
VGACGNLHSVHFANCNRSSKSTKKKIYKLANAQPRTGNPTISQETLGAKEIKKAINVKAGVTEADVSEFFDDAEEGEDEDGLDDEDAGILEPVVPSAVTASLPGHRSSNVSVISSTNQSTAAAASTTNKKTRGNMITSAIQEASIQTKASFDQYILSKQMVEEYEWKQHRIEHDLLEQQHQEEHEEDRRRREEELHEMKLKESRQQQQMNNFLQFADRHDGLHGRKNTKK